MRHSAIALLIFLAAVAPSARADCPESFIDTGAYFEGWTYTSTEAEYNFDQQPMYAGVPCRACYSWPLGYFRAGNSSAQITNWSLGVRTTGRFQLVGPPSDEPLTFYGYMLVSGSVESATSADMGIGEGSDVTQNVHLSPSQTVHDIPLVLTLSKLPGESFDLYVRGFVLTDTYSQAGVVSAIFYFTNVPEGYSIQMCQGLDAPTPVAPTSWGSLKARYR